MNKIYTHLELAPLRTAVETLPRLGKKFLKRLEDVTQ
jgi:hypothetical protein